MRGKLSILLLLFCLTLSGQNVPTVTTDAATNVQATSCTSGGNVTDDGGLTVTGRGVCWSLSHNPTYSDNKTLNGPGTGTFTSSVTNLVAVHTYYIRAYAMNAAGIGYGGEVSVNITILSSVPDNETFSLSDVTSIVTAASDDLLDCFDEATASRFDRTYYPAYLVAGPNALIENSLLNFRNYEAPLRPPLDFSCVERKTTSLHWTWVDNSWDEQGFLIERSDDGVSGWTEVETTAANIEGWTDTGLDINTTYYFRIRSFSGGLHSEWVTGYTTTLNIEADDWYLPSLHELKAMWTNLKSYGVGNFTTDYYWSSTQSSHDEAWVVHFTDGSYLYSGKDQLYSVRAICSFVDVVNAYDLRDTGPHGGLIFYIKSEGGTYTYFEAKTTDQSTNYLWSNVQNSVTTAVGVGMGLFNTFNIITQAGHTDSAAKLCNDL